MDHVLRPLAGDARQPTEPQGPDLTLYVNIKYGGTRSSCGVSVDQLVKVPVAVRKVPCSNPGELFFRAYLLCLEGRLCLFCFCRVLLIRFVLRSGRARASHTRARRVPPLLGALGVRVYPLLFCLLLSAFVRFELLLSACIEGGSPFRPTGESRRLEPRTLGLRA